MSGPGRHDLLLAAAALVLWSLAAGAIGAPPMPPDADHRLFVTADQCMACHNGMVTPRGEDLSIGLDWSASMMANSARDPYWQAAVRREVLEHPEAAAAIQDECAACHMPMARYRAKLAGGQGAVFAHLPFQPNASHQSLIAEDGVSCTMCHQITADDLGEPESFVAGFTVDTGDGQGPRDVYGPFQVDDGRQTIMRSATGYRPAEGDHIQGSGLCASCHTLYTHTRGAGGEVIGKLPEQMPYLEWRHSRYADTKSCQDCHLPEVEGKTQAAAVLGEARADVSRHVFRGGNFLMPRILDRYRDELGVTATSRDLQTASRRTVEHLQSASARIALPQAEATGETLRAVVAVENLAGHKLPTAYPSRRAWIHLVVKDRTGATVFESGAFRPDGAIAGNDNDADPRRYEPHHRRISRPADVQIYEAIMAGPEGMVTTGLLTGIRYVKDNRVLPHGFDKATAGEDIAVQGEAYPDEDFTGGHDRVVYEIPLQGAAGPYQVRAELWYQPIAYRWAHNLAPFDAPETNRFVRYYREMAGGSAVVLAQASATVGAP